MRRNPLYPPPLMAVDLMAVALVGFCLALPVVPWARAVVAVPLVTFLPGAAVLRALKPVVSGLPAFALAMALSLSLAVLGGLALGAIGWLSPGPWLCWFGGITLFADYLAGPAAFLTRAAPPTAQETVVGKLRPIQRVRPRHVALCVATLVVAAYTVQNATRNANAWLPFPFTDFWMLPVNRLGNLYIIGIRNCERSGAEPFTVRLMVDDRIVATWQVTVPQAETVTRTIALPPGRKAVAWLLRGTSPIQVYREVSASLPRSGSAEEQ